MQLILSLSLETEKLIINKKLKLNKSVQKDSEESLTYKKLKKLLIWLETKSKKINTHASEKSLLSDIKWINYKKVTSPKIVTNSLSSSKMNKNQSIPTN